MNPRKTNGLYFMLLLVGVGLIAGCAETTEGDTAAGMTSAAATADCCGWWCTAHAVPEEECSICSDKMAAQFKEEGDWCAEHDRAESQCFLCNPEAEAKFAARYEAKFGEAPPKS